MLGLLHCMFLSAIHWFCSIVTFSAAAVVTVVIDATVVVTTHTHQGTYK
jgi:hypothetical protein